MGPKKRAQVVKGAKNGIAIPSTSSGRITRAKRAPVATPKATTNATKKSAKSASKTTGKTVPSKENDTEDDSVYDYEDVEASWDTRVEYSIVTETATGGTITLEGSVNGTGPLEETERIAKLFDNASARNLTLNIRDDSTKAIAYYSAVFKLLKYKNLTINFEGEYDHAKFFESFFPTITQQSLSEGKLTLKWECDRPQNLTLLRHALRSMPAVDELAISCSFKDKNGKDNFGLLFDDATLRHVVVASNEAKLDAVHAVTAQGVLDAFEEVCKSASDKFVMLHLKDELVDEVFRLGELQSGKQMNSTVLHRRLLDPKRGKILVEWGKSTPDTTPIVMQRHQEASPSPNKKK